MTERPPAFLPPSEEMSAFLTAIKRAPRDDTYRIAFADWLDRSGDPRGELIRAQCALPGLDRNNPSYQQVQDKVDVLEKAMRAWIGPLPEEVSSSIIKGLLCLRIHPFQTFHERLIQLSERECWAWIYSLDCSEGDLVDAQVKLLVESSLLLNFACLNLSRNRIRIAGAEALANSPCLQNLALLDLSYNYVGFEGAKAMADSPYLHNLTFLDLRYNEINLAAMGAELRDRFGQRSGFVYVKEPWSLEHGGDQGHFERGM